MSTFDQEINDAIGRISALEGLPPKVAASAALKIDHILEEQYKLGTDPYGTPWKDLKEGGSSHLQQEPGTPWHRSPPGAMRAFSTVEAHGSDIVMHIPDPGGFHQTGTRYMPARKLEPEGTLPPAYEVAILQAASEAGLR